MKKINIKLLIGLTLTIIYLIVIVAPYYVSGYYQLYQKSGYDFTLIDPGNGLGIHQIKFFDNLAYLYKITGLGEISLLAALVFLANSRSSSFVEAIIKNFFVLVTAFSLYKAHEMLCVIGAVLE